MCDKNWSIIIHKIKKKFEYFSYKSKRKYENCECLQSNKLSRLAVIKLLLYAKHFELNKN